MDRWQIIDEIAAELGVKPNTRRMWRARGRVPFKRQLDILDAAQRKRVKPPLKRDDFEQRA
jgi:uncharacterized protein YjcR